MFSATIVISGTATQTKFEMGSRYATAEEDNSGVTIRFCEDFFQVESMQVADKSDAGVWMTAWCKREI